VFVDGVEPVRLESLRLLLAPASRVGGTAIDCAGSFRSLEMWA
jgi:hypothetical protein